ncbi:MAG TPA: exodeoxyribonuclease V subunit beta [Pseudomonadales bacterium]|nr:exodeoxyribonuclease V subunit beta [Pseudomonadales bacterium]
MIRLDPCTLPLAGRCLIEASAGTGKTYTITSIVLRLLLGHAGADGPPVPPRRVQEILIVTFTKAATEELRGRIRKRLRAAREAFETGAPPPADTVIAALLAASEDRAEDSRRLRLAEMELDLASIFTIHGFANRMLKRNAFESRISFAAELSESDAAVVTEAIRDIWRERAYPLPPLPASLLLAEHDCDGFVAAVRRLLGKQGLELRNVPEQDWDGVLAQMAAAESALLAWWRASAATAREALAGTALNKGGRTELAAALPRLDAAAAGHATLDRRTLAGVSRTFLSGELTKRKGNLLPELALFDLAETLLVAARALWPRLLADALAIARERLAAIKERTGLLGYEDLLRLLDEGLRAPGGERLAAAIRSQYPVALIDEFQDTDPLQWSVFSAVYAGDDTALFLVGDPKQAIYAFRGADVQAYLQVRREAAGTIRSLDTNYRSVQPLVEAVNALFRLRSGGDPFLAGDDMPFQAVLASGAPDKAPLRRHGQPVTPLAVLHLASAQPLSGTAYRARMAAAAANHLAGLLGAADSGGVQLGDEPLAPGHIACLVRDWQDAKRLAAELDRRGVPHVYRSRDSVYAGPQALDLYQLLAAVLEPGSERLLRAALGSALLGRTAAELDALRSDEAAFAREQGQFLGFSEELRLHGVQAMLRRLLFAYEVPARLLATPAGERALTDCLHLVELLQAEREGLDSDEALLARLAERIAGADGEQEAQQLRLESDAKRVQIVTLHSSKGLEYPVVYLPFMPIFKPAQDAFFHDPDTLVACYDLQGTEASRALAERERLAEDMRLLYVGLTRAAQLCVLGIGDTKRGNHSKSELWRSALGHLVGAGPGDGAAAAAIARLGTLPGTKLIDVDALPFVTLARASAPVPALAARRFDTPIERDWQSSSYSALTRHADARAAQLFRQPELAADASAAQARERSLFGFPRGARHGSFMHGLLERIDFSQRADAPATRQLIARALVREGYEADWLPVFTAMIEDVLGCALDGARLRLGALAPQQRVVEMGFEFPLAELDCARLNALLAAHDPLARAAPPLAFAATRGMLTGFIDLVFEHEGRFYVADYKSNHLGNELGHYEPARLGASIAEHRYDLQYALYTVALTRLLRARLGAAYDYDTHVGGVFYLYLRGMRAAAGPAHGVFHARPPRALVEALDALFAGDNRDVA